MLVILSNAMLFIIFFPLTKISENSSAEYYQNNKKKTADKSLWKIWKSLSKRKT